MNDVAEARVLRFSDEGTEERSDLVAHEEPLEIQVQGASVAVLMRTPGHDEDLAMGFLLTEGVIRSAEEVRHLEHCSRVADPEAEENVLRVHLGDDVFLDRERLRRNLYASASCGVCGKATIESALVTKSPFDDAVCVSAEVLFGLSEKLRAAQAAFDATGGLHAAGLFTPAGELVFVREDVGRHNAVDKVVGAALREGRSLLGHVLLVSGRVSFEIVQKAVAARIPMVAGISAPSSLAVRYADALGLTLVGFLRGRSLNAYAHAERIMPLPSAPAG